MFNLPRCSIQNKHTGSFSNCCSGLFWEGHTIWKLKEKSPLSSSGVIRVSWGCQGFFFVPPLFKLLSDLVKKGSIGCQSIWHYSQFCSHKGSSLCSFAVHLPHLWFWDLALRGDDYWGEFIFLRIKSKCVMKALNLSAFLQYLHSLLLTCTISTWIGK